MSPAFRRSLVILVLALVFLGGAFAFDRWWIAPQQGQPEEAQRASEPTAPSATVGAGIGGPFTLTDQNGVIRHDTDFHGKLMLVYFGYAFCPDACPTTLLAMSTALDELGPASEQIQPLFITIDPARDTPKELKLYGTNFSPRIIMLTGSPEATAAAAKAYKVTYEKAPQEGGGDEDYLMYHTSFVYAMGRDGAFLKEFSPGVTAEQMAAGLKMLTSAKEQLATRMFRSSEDAAKALPCSAVKHAADGSWTMTGQLIVGGITTTDGEYDKGSDEASILDKRCAAQDQ